MDEKAHLKLFTDLIKTFIFDAIGKIGLALWILRNHNFW